MIDRRDVITGRSSAGYRRWTNSEDLCCPVCRRGVRPAPPGYWKVADGPLPQWSHRDGRALCLIHTDDGPRRAEPVERGRSVQRTARVQQSAARRDPGAGGNRVD